MAKLSDFQTQQPTRNFLAEELVARNAAKIHPAFHWSDTRIAETQGSAESRPYARDAAVKSVGRRKRLHAVMDRCFSDANIAEGEQTKKCHAILDRLMDEEEEEEPDDDEEPKEESDAEEALDGLHAELRRVFRTSSPKKSTPKAKTVRRSSSYVCDADYIAKFVNPDLTCVEVENWLYDKVYARQKTDSNRSYWVGLSDFLRSQPDGARIRDCRPQTLSMLVSKTLAA
ncbi:MAG TPA: hypothetical protein VMJ93_11195 [Verrucomicrobiae bacterium]|nr:hypothetical protein [Verrucomicrobiae bacterium]